jgi:hypothetical protein
MMIAGSAEHNPETTARQPLLALDFASSAEVRFGATLRCRGLAAVRSLVFKLLYGVRQDIAQFGAAAAD